MLFADIQTDWLQISSGLASLGFAVWYAWWVTTRTIPEMQQRHDAVVRELVGEFRGDVQQMRMEFVTVAREGHEAIGKLSTAVSDLSLSVRHNRENKNQ